MLFTSSTFLLGFLPVAFIGFFLIGRKSKFGAAAWLAGASLFFYGYWDYRYVGLLVCSALFNYAAGVVIARRKSASRNPYPILLLAIAADLALLGYFKYTDFFIGTINGLVGSDLALMHVVLPLGISFFTFTQIAFLADAYRGIAREYSFVHYLLFVTYFPHLIAGPILHHKQVMPQFESLSTYRLDLDSISMGICFFIIGFAKKVILADSFGAHATPIFDAARDGEEIPFVLAWAGALSYTLQLYFDFSGYSDMAVGLSKLFGVNIPLNFNSPYKSRNIIEFWRRWHITLSNFLRDYLYIPLGGNRHGKTRRYVNLFTTMVLGGLWHGANWTFVAWGALHGVALIINHGWLAVRRRFSGDSRPAGRGARLAATGLTFLTVIAAWVLFRAETWSAALVMLKGMSGAGIISLPAQLSAWAPYLPGNVRFDGPMWSSRLILDISGSALFSQLILGLLIVMVFPNSQQIVTWIRRQVSESRLIWPIAIWMGGMFAVSTLFTYRSEFLYFQF